jgi:ATP-dependent Clp protease ATP-binding subunit ClpA
VLTLAQEEAERSGHSYIGTEHLLLGILRENEGLGGHVLLNLGLDTTMVRRTMESVLVRHERILIQTIIPTSRVKKVIEISFEEAFRLGHNYVGTEHLLLGLLIEGEGIAAHVLEDLGATLEKVRAEIERMVIAEGAQESVERPLAYKAGDRVLVHDANAPYRLWEGRIKGVDQLLYEVSVVGHPEGEVATVELRRIHPVPMTFTRDCPFCRDK